MNAKERVRVHSLLLVDPPNTPSPYRLYERALNTEVQPTFTGCLKGANMTTNDALQKSIEHHEENLSKLKHALAIINGVDITASTCPLCAAHNSSGDCDGCPVQAGSSGDGCKNTPYENLATELETLGEDLNDTIEAEEKEIAFLKSLVKPARKKIAIGQRWICAGSEYLLASVEDFKVGLVDISDGYRGGATAGVHDLRNITDDEWYEITAGEPDEWTRVNDSKK